MHCTDCVLVVGYVTSLAMAMPRLPDVCLGDSSHV